MKESWDDTARGIKDSSEDMTDSIKSFSKIVADTLKSVFESIGRAAFDFVVSIIRGVKTMEEAFVAFAQKIQTVVVDALLNMAVVAASTGNYIAAIFLGLGALVVAVF